MAMGPRERVFDHGHLLAEGDDDDDGHVDDDDDDDDDDLPRAPKLPVPESWSSACIARRRCSGWRVVGWRWRNVRAVKAHV
jgi:hypothetical protein